MAGRSDPDVPYRYQLDMGHVTCVRFNEVQGLKCETEVIELREGGNNFFKKSLVGGNSFTPLTIKKGFYSAGSEFYRWMRKIHIGNKANPIERVNMSLVILNDKFEEVGRFNLYKCFPTSYDGPSFNSTAKEITFESITIKYDFFEYHPGSALAGAIDALINLGSNMGLSVGGALNVSLGGSI